MKNWKFDQNGFEDCENPIDWKCCHAKLLQIE